MHIFYHVRNGLAYVLGSHAAKRAGMGIPPHTLSECLVVPHDRFQTSRDKARSRTALDYATIRTTQSWLTPVIFCLLDGQRCGQVRAFSSLPTQMREEPPYTACISATMHSHDATPWLACRQGSGRRRQRSTRNSDMWSLFVHLVH